MVSMGRGGLPGHRLGRGGLQRQVDHQEKHSFTKGLHLLVEVSTSLWTPEGDRG